jgi:Fe/S biogenesis protein NfuA
MTRTDAEVEAHIYLILETEIAPAVAEHGGKINFISYSNGVLNLELSGACAGCAGSKMTLKMGVERLLKEEIPELVSVEAVDDVNSQVAPYYAELPKPQFGGISIEVAGN